MYMYISVDIFLDSTQSTCMIPIYVRTSSTGIDLIWPGAWDLSSPETLVCMPPVKYVQLTADNRLFVCTSAYKSHIELTRTQSTFLRITHPSPRTRLSYPMYVGI